MLQDGWTFDEPDGSTGDSVNGKSKLSEIYLHADPRYTGRVTVPVLWDKKRKTIVNNESPEIIRMLNSAFDAFTNCAPIIIRKICAQRSTASTIWSIRTSTMAFIAPALPPAGRL